ncbi:M23 family metallopeptidase, partial [Streptococcus pyogenes]
VVDSSDADGGGCVEYGHMWNAFATGLKLGDRVEVGQLLGYVGSNGQSTGPHLHVTVWERGYGGKRVDPETWLQDAAYPPPGGGRAP